MVLVCSAFNTPCAPNRAQVRSPHQDGKHGLPQRLAVERTHQSLMFPRSDSVRDPAAACFKSDTIYGLGQDRQMGHGNLGAEFMGLATPEALPHGAGPCLTPFLPHTSDQTDVRVRATARPAP